jgi:mannose-1-phosphate guanylyltransferase
MRALLLAAGLGTRLRPITNAVPKCLVEIEGRPLLDYWIELLVKGGITDILINLHYLPEAVLTYIAQCRYPVRISTVYEERLLGTAGTLLKNRAFFMGEPVMLIHADNLSVFDPHAFIDRFFARERNIEITMMTFHTDAPQACGIVELDEKGVVREFHEKVSDPPGNLANAAAYILSPAVVAFIAGLGKQATDFSNDVLPSFMGRINTFHNGTYHRDIGTVESLRAAQREYPAVVANHWPASGLGQDYVPMTSTCNGAS